MGIAVNAPARRLWLGAAVALLACQSGSFAQIGKVDCHDQPCCLAWWPHWTLRECLPCRRRCPPLDPNFGYHSATWRLWPGTKANTTYESKQDLILNPPASMPGASKDKSSPGGAAMPAKEPPPAQGPAARLSTPLTTLPDSIDEVSAPGSYAPAKRKHPQG